MAKKRTYEDDDGRTIADMSGLEPMPMLFPRIPKAKRSPRSQRAAMTARGKTERRSPMTSAGPPWAAP